jgi:hypothetical protein
MAQPFLAVCTLPTTKFPLSEFLRGAALRRGAACCALCPQDRYVEGLFLRATTKSFACRAVAAVGLLNAIAVHEPKFRPRRLVKC